MSGFSPEWLALREPVDHRSRSAQIARQLGAHFAGRAVSVVDLGCGTGSNLRATSVHLGPVQRWTLVDYDPRLLAAARTTLTAWADEATDADGGLVLRKAGSEIAVGFVEADLNRDFDRVLAAKPDLVTAAAFFDLASPEFIGHLVTVVTRARAAFYTALTYNGQQTWSPRHAADRALLEAFHAHQRGDKGFGPSAGPAAPTALAATFQSAAYHVSEGDSPWELGPGDAGLIRDLAQGFAAAAAETGHVDAAKIAAWAAIERDEAVVGHTDTLALPPA